MVDKQEWVHNLPDAALEWLGGRRVEEVECIVPRSCGDIARQNNAGEEVF